MNKKDVVLVAITAEKNATFTPSQIQKLLFLIEKKIGETVGGPFFNFVPHWYGPFDVGIFSVLEELSSSGDVEIEFNPINGFDKYTATRQGQLRGEKNLDRLDKKIKDYIRKLSEFVRGLTFTELIGIIYQEYPKTYDEKRAFFKMK